MNRLKSPIPADISALGSQGDPSKTPQAGCLRTSEMYHITVLETRSPKSGCWRHAPFEGVREGSIPGLSPTFWEFPDLWRSNSNFHMAFSLCVCVCLFLFTGCSSYKDTTPIQLGTALLWDDLIVTNFICKDPSSKEGHI